MLNTGVVILPVCIAFEMFWSFPHRRSCWFNIYLCISTSLGHLICFPPNKVLFFIIVSGSTILLNHVTKHLRNFIENLLVKKAYTFEHLQMFTPLAKLMLDFSLICNSITCRMILPFTACLHLSLICAFPKI